MNIARNNVELYEQFCENRAKLYDYAWLAETLKPHCKLKFMRWRGSRLRVIQFPDEFARWLVLLAKLGTQSYLEVGTSTGGSFFTTDSYLRAAVPGFRGSVGYDRTAKLRDWDLYKARFPATEFRNQSSADMDVRAESFGAAFIDARHVERWVLADFERVRKSAEIVGFHDILRPGVDLAWAKIKRTGSFMEFCNTDVPKAAQCGIGCVSTAD
jgi:hypothetical protein